MRETYDFRSIGKGYLKYCSKKCSAQDHATDPEKRAAKISAYKESMHAVVDDENHTRMDLMVENRKKTMVERYGVEFYSQHADYKQRCQETMMERYGVKSYMSTPEMQQKSAMRTRRSLASTISTRQA